MDKYFSGRDLSRDVNIRPPNIRFDQVGADDVAINNTIILYTVPENKILHILHTFLHWDVPGGYAGEYSLGLYDSSSALLFNIYAGTNNYGEGGGDVSDNYLYPPYLLEGESIKVISGSAVHRIHAGFFGILEDV